jgi:hypothetical protein
MKNLHGKRCSEMSNINANLLSSKIADAANKASAGMSVDSSFFNDTL